MEATRFNSLKEQFLHLDNVLVETDSNQPTLHIKACDLQVKPFQPHKTQAYADQNAQTSILGTLIPQESIVPSNALTKRDQVGLMKQTSKDAAEFSNFFINGGQTSTSKNNAFGLVNKSPYSSQKSSIKRKKEI